MVRQERPLLLLRRKGPTFRRSGLMLPCWWECEELRAAMALGSGEAAERGSGTHPEADEVKEVERKVGVRLARGHHACLPKIYRASEAVVEWRQATGTGERRMQSCWCDAVTG